MQEYLDKADGKHLVFDNPYNGKTEVVKILLATERNGEIRMVDEKEPQIAYKIVGREIFWMGYLRGTEKAMAASPGSEFRGWKRTKQRRLTDAEISDLIKDKIFVFGGVDV